MRLELMLQTELPVTVHGPIEEYRHIFPGTTLDSLLTERSPIVN